MEGYRFTFGGYKRLDWLDKAKKTISHVPRRGSGDILEIKRYLSHPVFGETVIMRIVRDYLPGGALLPTDLFPERSIDSNEIYQILSSVSCCKWCTKDVMDLVSRFAPSPDILGLSPEQELHLMCKYDHMNNMEGFEVVTSYLYENFSSESYESIIGATSTRNILSLLIFRRDYAHTSTYVVFRGIMARISGKYFQSSGSEVVFDEVGIDSLFLFGRRRHMRRMKKEHGRNIYYGWLFNSVYRASYMRSLPSNDTLGLEEKIILSMATYYLILHEGEPTAGPLPLSHPHLHDIWELPSKLLREGCNVRGENDFPDAQGFTLLYEGKEYTVGVEKRNNPTRVVYTCGNGVEYPYLALLFIITERFLFTYDKDYILDILGVKINPSDKAQEYLSTVTTLPPVYDLICPPDALSSTEFGGK